MKSFTYIWLGQLVSATGTGLTGFAVGVWVYQRTGSVTHFSLIALFSGLPSALILPVAGALIDRWDRRRTMIISNAGAALTTLAAAILLLTGGLEVWHIYLGLAVRGAFAAFLNPAFLAATTLLVPKRHFGRASGMFQAVQASAQVISPSLAAILIDHVQLKGILFLDFLSYLAAIAALLRVAIPKPDITKPEKTAANEAPRGSLAREITYGWTFIRERHGLLALLIYFAAVNLALGLTTILFTPMVLGFTTTKALGTIVSISGLGLLCGSVVMSLWGGPKTKLRGVLVFGFLFGLSSVVAGLRPSAVTVAAGAFAMFFVLPVVNGCSQAIWQSKVPADLQGRVFAFRRMIGACTLPLGYSLAGPLADRLFEPLINEGALGEVVGSIIGKGPGRGMGVMFIAGGVVTMLAQGCAYLYAPLRRVESDVPDAPHPIRDDMIFPMASNAR